MTKHGVIGRAEVQAARLIETARTLIETARAQESWFDTEINARFPERVCGNPTCAKLYSATRPDRRFCSNRCGNAVRQRERRAAAGVKS